MHWRASERPPNGRKQYGICDKIRGPIPTQNRDDHRGSKHLINYFHFAQKVAENREEKEKSRDESVKREKTVNGNLHLMCFLVNDFAGLAYLE